MRRVSDVMTSGVRTTGQHEPLRRAAEIMAALNVGSVPVCNGNRLVGVITDRDITIRAIARGLDPATTPIREVMTVAPQYCFDTDPIERAAALMQQLQIRRLPVIDGNDQLVGIVTLGDIAVRGGPDNASRTLASVSTPAEPVRAPGLSFERQGRAQMEVPAAWALAQAHWKL